jgi:hypothetical protein
MIASLILYGSRARGDYRPKSDVDLLALTENGPIRNELVAGGVSLYHYPYSLLLSRAESGNLFALHLVKEGKILHDSFGAFRSVCDAFGYKDSYTEEITEAYLVIRFIFARRELLGRKDVRKRLIWAVRTILIARSAEDRTPFFSSEQLARYAKISELKDVIDNRNQNDVERLHLLARKVAKRFAEETVLIDWPSDKAGQRALMKERGGIAADTLRFVQPKGLLKRNVQVERTPDLDDGGPDYS